jgi:aromatic ring-opening dioxygenase LigB subunit
VYKLSIVSNPSSCSVAYAALMPHAPILIPAVAGERVVRIQSTIAAMREAAQCAVAAGADAVVVISPHAPREAEEFGIWTDERLRGTLRAFGAPEESVDFQNDVTLAAQIAYQAAQRGVPTRPITDLPLDHGTVVPLWFVAEAGWHGPVVATGLSLRDHLKVVEFGEAIAAAAIGVGKRVAFIASGDMSHRLTSGAPCGFDARGAEFDQWLIGALRRGRYRELLDFSPDLERAAAEDALDSVLVAFGAIGFNATGTEILSYDGPFGVGYGVAILYSEAVPRSQNLWLRH